jgi:hypothetical protein
LEIMSPTNPLLKDGPMPQPPDPNGEAFEPGSRAGAGRTLVSTATDGSVGAAFNVLLASRFVQHSDVVIGLTREMLRPMLKTWLDDICRASWSALSLPKSSGSRAASKQGAVAFALQKRSGAARV